LDILGNSPEIVRKHCATLSPARPFRIDDLMERVNIRTDWRSMIRSASTNLIKLDEAEVREFGHSQTVAQTKHI
jgi:hypothetical protein